MFTHYLLVSVCDAEDKRFLFTLGLSIELCSNSISVHHSSVMEGPEKVTTKLLLCCHQRYESFAPELVNAAVALFLA